MIGVKMIVEYICDNCGTSIFPTQITNETLHSKNTDMSVFRDPDICFSIKPCKCTLGDKNTIVKALKDTLDNLTVGSINET